MSPSGYSSRTLTEKLGIKSGMTIYFANMPSSVQGQIKLPKGITMAAALLRDPVDFIHCFSMSRSELAKQFPIFVNSLSSDGILWVSWPKRAARMRSNLTEDIVREIGLANGLVDVKVIAVDETWSGLKFVWRLKERPSH
jgi:hypothetical protein